MDVLELQKRIKNTLELVNNAKSISTKRRYFVHLSGLVSIYNQITGSEIEISELNNQKIMKHTFYQNFVAEIGRTYGILAQLSDGILQARKDVGCDFREHFVVETYSKKYLREILESFLASLGPRFYNLYKDATNEKRLFYNQKFGGGLSVFDYQELKTIIFAPYDQETIAFLVTLVHELGHTFDYEYTKCSRKAILVNQYNVNLEVFSMLMELLLLDYLKSIHFDPQATLKMEEKFYNDLIGFSSEVNFGLSLSMTLVDPELNLVIYDYNEAEKKALELTKRYGIDYYLDDINFEDSINYMYGGLIATIYRYYYSQDKSFIQEIFKHFLDYESYTTEEILENLPFVKDELNGYPILRKKLAQIKTNQG